MSGTMLRSWNSCRGYENMFEHLSKIAFRDWEHSQKTSRDVVFLLLWRRSIFGIGDMSIITSGVLVFLLLSGRHVGLGITIRVSEVHLL